MLKHPALKKLYLIVILLALLSVFTAGASMTFRKLRQADASSPKYCAIRK
jgi:hypothetical protein